MLFTKGKVKAMEKKRVRLDICGVSCTLITEESEEYMRALGAEVSKLMSEILSSSPASTVQLAAVTAALSYLDENKQSLKKIRELENRDNNNKELAELKAIIDRLKLENAELSKSKAATPHNAFSVQSDIKNPMRPDVDETGLVSFFEKEK